MRCRERLAFVAVLVVLLVYCYVASECWWGKVVVSESVVGCRVRGVEKACVEVFDGLED